MRLPNGYTRLEYIQSSGGQYIDSLFTPNNKTRIEVKFSWAGGSNGYLYGAVDSNNAKSVTATLSVNGGNWRFDGTYYSLKASANTIYSAVIDSSGVTINGTLNKYVGTVSSFTSPNTLFIFSGHNASGVSASYFVGKIYTFGIYDNGTLVRDFIPCKNASGDVGLYDIANGVFYENKGSSSFTAGAEIVPEYKIVDADELDSAIGATADAIREKTGDTAKIAWDASSGFASAIAAISSGGKVATGTFTISEGNTNRDGELFDLPQTITGLPFTPTRVIFFADLLEDMPQPYSQDYILYGDSQSGKCLLFDHSEYYDEDDYSWETWDIHTGGSSYGFLIEMKSYGFTIRATTDTSSASSFDWIQGHTYHYIAIG